MFYILSFVSREDPKSSIFTFQCVFLMPSILIFKGLLVAFLSQAMKILIIGGNLMVWQGNGQCGFIWNDFLRNWKFEPSQNIVSCNWNGLYLFHSNVYSCYPSNFSYHLSFAIVFLGYCRTISYLVLSRLRQGGCQSFKPLTFLVTSLMEKFLILWAF